MSTKKVLIGILTVIGYALMIAIMLPIAFILELSKSSRGHKRWYESSFDRRRAKHNYDIAHGTRDKGVMSM